MRVEVACSLGARLRGLIGRDALDGALLLVPCNDVHTFGMKRSLDVAFVSSRGYVLESYRAVGPRRRIRCRSAVATVERFASGSPWFEEGDRVGFVNCTGEEELFMKSCPVCQAVAFDDAAICFGCMHEFSDDDRLLPAPTAGSPPEFRIKFTPLPDQSGTVSWKCAVEM